MTKKQTQTLDYVNSYIRQSGFPPTYKLIEEKFNIDASAAHFRCRNFRHLMNRNGNKKRLTESEFIEKFKNEGFELYKTADLKPKLVFYHKNAK